MDKNGSLGFVSTLEYQQSPNAQWLFLLRDTSHNEDDPDEQKNLRGLLYAIAGRNIAYEKFFSFKIEPNGKLRLYLGCFLNPKAFPSIDMTMVKKQLDWLEAHLYSSTNIVDKMNIGLSWYTNSMESSGIDAFLKIWVAFEALAMKNTNVKSSYPFLSEIYDSHIREIKNRFLLGKIHGYRSDIIHGNYKRSFALELLEYLTKLVEDIIIYKIFGQKQKKAFDYLERNEKLIISALKKGP